MAAKVQIVVEAQDKASGALKVVESAFSGIQNRIASILSANLIEDLGRKMIEFGKDAVDATVKYANQVRELQLVSGQTAEEASRMIQVFDDFKISVDSLTPAFRKMTNEGLTPNIETLAKLSDQYLALQTPLERNKLLMDKFGRAGMDMAEMMSKGGDAIRSMGDAISESLILDQKAVDAARQYELALDNLNDTVEGLKISIGNKLIPVLTDAINGFGLSAEYTRVQTMQMKYLKDALDAGSISQEQFTEKALSFGIAQADVNAILGTTAAQLGNVADGVKEIKDYGSDVSFVLSFQTQTDNFETKKEEILSKMTELKDKIIATQQEIAAGTANADALGPLNEEMVGLTNELNKNEAAFKRWQKQAVFSLIQTKLAADGLTDVEFDQLMSIGEEMGILDPAVVDQATTLMDTISSVDASGLNEAVKNVKYLVSQDGKQITIYVTEVQTESPTGGGYAGGGSFTVPMGYPNDTYMVGLSSGEQVTVSTPSQQAQGGTVNNYSIYGATFLLQQGQEGGILAELTE